MAGAGYKLFTAGAVLTAAQMNTFVNEQTVMVFASTAARDAALTTVKAEGNLTYQSDTNNLTSYSGTLWSTVGPVSGALTAWTPAIVQLGSVTSTNTYSTYSRVGRQVTFSTVQTVTGTGTAANVVTLTLPVNAVTTGGGFGLVGTGFIVDTSAATRNTGHAVILSATTIRFGAVTGTVEGSYLGTTIFTQALAAGDTVAAYGTYEAAADA